MLMAIVFRQDLGLPSFVLVVAGVHGRENLPVGVHDDVAAQETVFAQDCVVADAVRHNPSPPEIPC
jgi:hypothetical protein